jgi:hypothetical protein
VDGHYSDGGIENSSGTGGQVTVSNWEAAAVRYDLAVGLDR